VNIFKGYRYHRVTKNEIKKSLNRISHLQDILLKKNISAAILFYSRDIFYYAGTAQPALFLVLPDYNHLVVRHGLDFAREDLEGKNIHLSEGKGWESIFQLLEERGVKEGTIATELDLLPTKTFFQIRDNIFNSRYKFSDISPLVLEQRKTKDTDEITEIEKACRTVAAGHVRILEVLREGISELELSVEIEDAHRRAGHEGCYFFRLPDFFMSGGIVASGHNCFKVSGLVSSISGVGMSSAVPIGASRKILKKGETIVIDVPALVNGYHADQSRTYFLGRASQKIKSLFNPLKDISDYLFDKINVGMKCSEIFWLAQEQAKALKVEKFFQRLGPDRKARFVGHGVGLEANEPPWLSDYDHSIIGKEFVLALDIHMMDEDVGVIKLEDMILVKEKGNIFLTETPRELFEI